MAIEIEPKTQREKGVLVKYSLYIGVALLLIMAAGYAFLYFSVNRAEQKLTDLEKQTSQQMSEEDKKLQRKIIRTQQKFERSSQVIDSHRSVYNFLTTLENNTHPHLRFNRMSLNADLNRVSLRGITEGFDTLGEQIKMLQKEDTVEKVKVGGAFVEKGAKIGFNLALTLNPKIFKFPPKQ